MAIHTIYFYAASDFVSGLPAESGAAAAGFPIFSLTLKAGAVPVAVEIEDGDGIFHEVDSTQKLASAATLGGTVYSANTTIIAAYDLINTFTGHKITSMHLGGTGQQTGAVAGISSTVELVPGTTYFFNQNRSSYLRGNQYDEYVACFTSGTQITTPTGPQNIETLEVGDVVSTLDHGAQTIRWIGDTTVLAFNNLAPIVVQAGTLGNSQDLAVSPEHRLLVAGPRIELLFGETEILVAAKHLVDGDRIYRRVGGAVTYHHVLFDQHEIIFANECPAESFYPDKAALDGLDADVRAELITLFPEFSEGLPENVRKARPSLKRHEAALIAGV